MALPAPLKLASASGGCAPWSRLAERIRLRPAPLLLGAGLSLGFRIEGLGFGVQGLGFRI